MLELSLEKLILRTLFSLTKEERQIFNTTISKGHPASLNEAFDTAIQCIMQTFFVPLDNESERQNIKDILMRCKPTVALYCAYYAMDYIARQENPDGTPFNSDFIKSTYTDNTYNVRNIYNKYRRQINKILDVASHPDPAYTNLGYMIKWSKDHPEETEPHVFLGGILLHLKDAISQESASQTKHTLYLHGLTPAVTLASIRVCNFLPNGTYVNRPSTIHSSKDPTHPQMNITGNTISKIDYEISVNKGGISYINDEQFYSFPAPKINYPVSNIALSDLINQSVFDDLYRMERLNTALAHYNALFHKDGENTVPASSISKSTEKALAGACSLYLSLPLSVSILLDNDMKCLTDAIISNNTEDEVMIEKKIMSISNIYFPYLIGLFCSILFVNHPTSLQKTDFNLTTLSSMTWEESAHIFDPIEDAATELRTESEIKDIISELETFLSSWTLKLNRSLLSQSDRIWYRKDLKNYNTNVTKATSRFRGKERINTQILWSNTNHHLSLDETLGIMLNQTSNIAKTRLLMDENYWTYCNQKTYIRLLSHNLDTTDFTKDNNLNKHTSENYLKALVNGFHNDIWHLS